MGKLVGRPKTKILELTEEQQIEAIRMAVDGKSMKQVADALLISRIDFWQYRSSHPSFSNKYDAARKEGLEDLADGLISIADDLSMDVHRAKLKSDNIKWILSKRKPETYGDRIDLHVSTNIDITKALEAAKSRIVSPPELSASARDEDDPLAEVIDTVPIIVTE